MCCQQEWPLLIMERKTRQWANRTGTEFRDLVVEKAEGEKDLFCGGVLLRHLRQLLEFPKVKLPGAQIQRRPRSPFSSRVLRGSKRRLRQRSYRVGIPQSAHARSHLIRE